MGIINVVLISNEALELDLISGILGGIMGQRVVYTTKLIMLNTMAYLWCELHHAPSCMSIVSDASYT